MPDSAAQAALAYLRPRSEPGTEILIANNSARIWRMFHDRYLICGFTTVATAWIYRGKSRFMSDGGTALFEPGETHRVTAALRPSTFRGIFVDADKFIERARETGCKSRPHFRTAQVMDLRLLDSLYRFSAAVENDETVLEQQSRFSELLNWAFGYAEDQPQAISNSQFERSLIRARDLLHEKFLEQISLDELVVAAAMSRYHLVRRFTRQFGLPPHAYQIHLRIKRACSLLRLHHLPSEAGVAVGFADQSHFARHFKKVMGVTPGTYCEAMNLTTGHSRAKNSY
ncbi:MAG TPA: AraC family transcriptional regulator [Candidatus Acidoferrum sp.]|nr:AraC family transcriptional regulator [Candidatus Acidoferrum sp.]